jgi:hypothetical protein
MGTRRDGGAAQHRRASKRMGAPAQILDLASLNVHPTDEHDFRPEKVLCRRAPDILIEEANLPGSRKVGGNNKEPLWWHVCAHAVGQGVRKFQGSERWGVVRKDQQNSPYAELVRKSHDLPFHLRVMNMAAFLRFARQPTPFHLLRQELAGQNWRALIISTARAVCPRLLTQARRNAFPRPILISGWFSNNFTGWQIKPSLRRASQIYDLSLGMLWDAPFRRRAIVRPTRSSRRCSGASRRSPVSITISSTDCTTANKFCVRWRFPGYQCPSSIIRTRGASRRAVCRAHGARPASRADRRFLWRRTSWSGAAPPRHHGSRSSVRHRPLAGGDRTGWLGRQDSKLCIPSVCCQRCASRPGGPSRARSLPRPHVRKTVRHHLEMQRFESCRPSQPVRSPRVKVPSRRKTTPCAAFRGYGLVSVSGFGLPKPSRRGRCSGDEVKQTYSERADYHR